MKLEEAQAKVASSIRARVHEIQWGGSIMPYVRHFENVEGVLNFVEETGYKVEAIIIGDFEGKPYKLNYSFDESCELPTTLEGDFTDEEKLQIVTEWQIHNL